MNNKQSSDLITAFLSAIFFLSLIITVKGFAGEADQDREKKALIQKDLSATSEDRYILP